VNTEDKPLVAWLGDDFTGAAAAMEVLAFAGVPSILFLNMPTDQQLARHRDVGAVGIATMARTGSPAWMEENLPAYFAKLDATGAALVHYKICSTLDSSPIVGSIGKAMELGVRAYGPGAVPVVTAAPQMRRYQLFGNLFAAAPEGVFRLDRHPVMSVHPVTPMTEADVALHLQEQTAMPMGCIDIEALADPKKAAALMEDGVHPAGWTLDMVDAGHEEAVGRLLWDRRGESRFVVGSQGVEYALVAHWRKAGELLAARPIPGIGHAAKMAIVSGSVSPVTAAQIAWARNNGFATIAFDAPAVCGSDDDASNAEAEALTEALAALEAGTPPIIYSAEGPDDPRVHALRQAAGDDLGRANDAIGKALGRIMRELIERTGLRRAVISGGDTSGHVCTELGIYALEAKAPTIPGASICTAKAAGQLDGLELALKGGQMGSPDYFGWVLEGGGERL
jgi:uncharacterized protein YgbK (DUF1537 family)